MAEAAWVEPDLEFKREILGLGGHDLTACYQCGHCNVYCPRDAKPADVMAALREYSIEHYAVPGFMAKALGEPKFLPLLFALPASILLVVLAGLGHLSSLPEGP